MDLNTELAELHEMVRVPELQRRRTVAKQFWDVVAPLLESASHLAEEEVGRSG